MAAGSSTDNMQGTFARMQRVRTLHESVVSKVIAGMKADPRLASVEPSSLDELKQRWITKLHAAGALATTYEQTGIVRTVGAGQMLVGPQYVPPMCLTQATAADAQRLPPDRGAPGPSGLPPAPMAPGARASSSLSAGLARGADLYSCGSAPGCSSDALGGYRSLGTARTGAVQGAPAAVLWEAGQPALRMAVPYGQSAQQKRPRDGRRATIQEAGSDRANTSH